MSKIKLITRDTSQPKKDDPTQKAYRYKYEVLVPAKLFGKRIRQYFKTKAGANDYKLELENKLQNEKLTPLYQDIHLCAVRFQKLLTVGQMEAALTQAVSHYSQSSMSLEELADSFVDQVTRDYKRGVVGKRYWGDIKSRAPKLATWMGCPDARDITKEMVEGFIDKRLDAEMKPRTVVNYCRILSAILQKGVNDKVILENPVSNVRMPKPDSTVHIIAPNDLRTLLSYAGRLSDRIPLITPRLMFGAFGGLRTSEIERLTWEDVRLDLGQFYVSPGKTKNAERWVVLTPPLLTYCEKMLPESKGPVLQGYSENYILGCQRKLCKAAGVNIPSNALRHSYGSHHLVHYNKPSATALEMGHYTAQMTFKAYRRAVTKVQAAAYWDIRVKV